MSKVDISKFNLQYMTETEALIRSSPQLYAQMNTAKKCSDFMDFDIVKCTYIKGLMRVLGTTLDGKIMVRPLLNFTEADYEAISPEFLLKVKIDEKMLDLLYAKEN